MNWFGTNPDGGTSREAEDRDRAEIKANLLFYMVAAASFVEITSHLYTQNLVRYFATDTEMVGWLTRVWKREELGHGAALKRYVQTTWPAFDWEAAYARFYLDFEGECTVTTPDLASLRNAKNMNDLLARLRPNDAPIRLILNQTGVQGRPEIPLREFARALEIDPSLVVPFDPKLFGDAANNGQMVMELNPKSKISEGLVQFANMLARRTTGAPPPPAGAQSLFARLLARR